MSVTDPVLKPEKSIDLKELHPENILLISVNETVFILGNIIYSKYLHPLNVFFEEAESEISKYVRDTEDSLSGKKAGELQSGEYRGIRMGVYYSYDYKLEGKIYQDRYAYLGTTDSSLSSLIFQFDSF